MQIDNDSDSSEASPVWLCYERWIGEGEPRRESGVPAGEGGLGTSSCFRRLAMPVTQVR